MLILLAACNDDPAVDPVVEVRDVVVTVDPVYATVVHVSWTTSEPTTGLVRFGEAALNRATAETALATEHSASLLGLPPGTEIGLQVAGVTEDGASVVLRVEVSVDGGEWRALRADDGVLDERREAFAGALPGAGVQGGEHVLSVRAADEAGNVGVGSVRYRR